MATPPRALRRWTDRSIAIENSQTKALAAIDRAAERSASRDATIVGEAGLDPAKLSPPHEQGGVGGPYIPVEIDAHALALDPALKRVARDVATAERLKALMSFVPLRMPLSGEPSLTSSLWLSRRSVSRPPRAASGRRSRRALRRRNPRRGRRARGACRTRGRLRNHGRDRSRQRARHPLRAHVGSAGRGRRDSRTRAPS